MPEVVVFLATQPKKEAKKKTSPLPDKNVSEKTQELLWIRSVRFDRRRPSWEVGKEKWPQFPNGTSSVFGGILLELRNPKWMMDGSGREKPNPQWRDSQPIEGTAGKG
jgi:hypothetical protein